MTFSGYFKNLYTKFNIEQINKDDGEYALFVGKNYQYYKKRWLKMLNENGSPKKFHIPSFNFGAALFTVFWLLYRKMYFYAFLALILAFVLSLIDQNLSIVLIMGLGWGANQLYLYYAQKKIEKIKLQYTGEGFETKLKQIGGVNFIFPIVGIVIIMLIITLNFIFNTNHANALSQNKSVNKPVYDDISDIKRFKAVSCNLNEKDIERIKNAFGKYYEYLIKILSENKMENYNGTTCIIRSQNQNALVIIDKNQVVGKLRIDRFAYKTSNFEEYFNSQKEMAMVWNTYMGKELFTIGNRTPRYEIPYENNGTMEHNNKTVIKNLKNRSLYDIRSFYKVGSHDIYLITQADDFQECPREFLFLIASEGNRTMVLPETPFCGIDDRFEEKIGNDAITVTFKKDKNTEFIVNIDKESFNSEEKEITHNDFERKAWAN